MPLAQELYHGVDLTSMEIAMYDLQTQFKTEKKAAFKSKDEKPKEGSGSAGDEKLDKSGDDSKEEQHVESEVGKTVVAKVDDDTSKEGRKEEEENKEGAGEKFEDARSDIDTKEASTSTSDDSKGSRETIRSDTTDSSSSMVKIEAADVQGVSKDGTVIPKVEESVPATVAPAATPTVQSQYVHASPLAQVQLGSHQSETISVPGTLPVVSSTTPQPSTGTTSTAPATQTLTISSTPAAPTPPDNTHVGHTCDGHDEQIVGTRYHCLEYVFLGFFP